jgi:chemotaxis protein histidine kinase CheA
VPLERLDKSAQQVVDTLLTARAVMNVSTQLQAQLNQLTNLTQESSQFVAKLRQLQDDYALMRNLSDEQDTGNNVTLERYRQGYGTINRLLENMLRMSELGQEIETASYQSSTRLDALDRSILRLKDGIETSRLVPFRNMTLRARAILRDLTNRYGKPAELIVVNEQIELDAGIVQQLEPVLLHLLRNAYDHGLEPVEQRLKAGKPAQGMIHLSLNRWGNLYRLTIEDDGGGIDRDRIAQIAKSKGFNLDRTSTSGELLAVLCQPGFSSSNTVSEVSGRGVGMDVVTAQIASINGKLSLETAIGHGTKFTIEVPAPQLLVPCVLFQVGDRIIALPTDEILETSLIGSMFAEPLDEDLGLCTWTLSTGQGRAAAFDLANYWQPSQRLLPDTAICIRTRQANDNAEIWSIADDLLGQAELLITPLPSPLIAPVGLLGVSLQPDGRLISILDPIALTAKIATATNDSSDYNLGTLTVEQAKSSAPTILIVDDAALMRRRFEASLNTHGFVTYTCNDGVEALNWLQSNPKPDLMITDVEMPNMDGFTLIDRCRQAKIEIPILVVSSRLSEEWGKEARRLGANDYLNKGFSTPELLQKVDQLLGLVVSG